MQKPRKLTDEQIARICEVAAQKRELYRQLNQLQTNAMLAMQFGVSKRAIDEITRNVSRESVTRAQLQWQQ